MPHFRIYWLLIFLTGFLLRVYRLDLPLLESQPNRQVMDAFIIRQLYRPETLSQVDFSLLGFPVYHSLVAGLYFIFGGENLFWGRFVSLVAALINFWLFIKIVRLFAPERIALWASFFFFVLSPINIVLSRAIQIEQTALVFGLTAIYFLARWSPPRRHYHWLSWFFFTLTLAQEATLAYLSFPLIAIFYLKHQQPWFYLATAFILTGGWYFLVMAPLNQAFPNGWGVALDPRIWISLDHLLSIKFWANVGSYFADWAVTPLVTVFVILGIFSFPRPPQLIFLSWLIGAVISFVYRSQPAIATHYYSIAFVAPASVIAAYGITSLISRFPSRRFFVPPWFLVMTLSSLATFFSFRTYITNLYVPHWKHEQVLAAAQQVKLLTPPAARVIASSYSSGILQFYLDRPGNSLVISPPAFDDANSTLSEFLRLKHQGAQYYVISDVSELDKNLPFKTEILGYPSVFATDQILLVKLTP